MGLQGTSRGKLSGYLEGGSSGGHRGLVFRGTSRVALQGDLVGGPSGGPRG